MRVVVNGPKTADAVHWSMVSPPPGRLTEIGTVPQRTVSRDVHVRVVKATDVSPASANNTAADGDDRDTDGKRWSDDGNNKKDGGSGSENGNDKKYGGGENGKAEKDDGESRKVENDGGDENGKAEKDGKKYDDGVRRNNDENNGFGSGSGGSGNRIVEQNEGNTKGGDDGWNSDRIAPALHRLRSVIMFAVTMRPPDDRDDDPATDAIELSVSTTGPLILEPL